MHAALSEQTTVPDSAPAQTEYVLTFVCEDRPGIVHAVTGAIVEAGGNITESRQFESGSTHRFYMRLQILAPVTVAQLETAIAPVVEQWASQYAGRLRVAKMDVDANPETPGRYGIMSIPTLILFKNGQEVHRHVGSRVQGLPEQIEAHL